MEEDDSLDAQDNKFVPIPPAARIKELVEIDGDLTKIVRSASDAFRALTPAGLDSSTAEQSNTRPAMDQAKDDFARHANDFFTTVQSVAARLRRQAYALDEANIISKDPPKEGSDDEDEKPKGAQPRQAGVRSMTRQVNAEPRMPITNGGLGNLDVGWLNSRRDEVGKQKEAELWQDARVMVEKFQNKQANGSHEDDDMEVDSPET